MEFINQWQFIAEDFPGEVNKESSMTEPNQTYSLREILRRSAVGMDVTSSMRRNDDYDASGIDVDDYVAPHGIDISEVAEEYNKAVEEYESSLPSVDASTLETHGAST